MIDENKLQVIDIKFWHPHNTTTNKDNIISMIKKVRDYLLQLLLVQLATFTLFLILPQVVKRLHEVIEVDVVWRPGSVHNRVNPPSVQLEYQKIVVMEIVVLVVVAAVVAEDFLAQQAIVVLCLLFALYALVLVCDFADLVGRRRKVLEIERNADFLYLYIGILYLYFGIG